VGLYFRKRIGLGPLALNFSKSGIGISAGMRGLRAGVSSHRCVYTSDSYAPMSSWKRSEPAQGQNTRQRRAVAPPKPFLLER
jgi:hypothetical protein